MRGTVLALIAFGAVATLFIIAEAKADCTPPVDKPNCCCKGPVPQAPQHPQCQTNCVATTTCKTTGGNDIIVCTGWVEATCWLDEGASCRRFCQGTTCDKYKCTGPEDCSPPVNGKKCTWTSLLQTEDVTILFCVAGQPTCNSSAACP